MDQEQVTSEIVNILVQYLQGDIGWALFIDKSSTTWNELAKIFKKCHENNLQLAGDSIRAKTLIDMGGNLNEEQAKKLERVITAWDEWTAITSVLKN